MSKFEDGGGGGSEGWGRDVNALWPCVQRVKWPSHRIIFTVFVLILYAMLKIIFNFHVISW